MLSLVLPHAASGGEPTTSWMGGFTVLVLVVLTAWLYVRGRRRAPGAWRRRRADLAFAAGSGVIVIALASPLDGASADLASMHMIQHILLMLVAAPLFAWSAPSAALLRGVPRGVLVSLAPVARGVGSVRRRVEQLATPAVVTTMYVAILWAWHVPVLYEAALRGQAVHVTEHASFFLAAFVFWSNVVFPYRRSLSPGARVLVLFGVAMQSVVLALLLTLARSPWYASYTATTRAWGLDPLEDQQLAGAIMWVPAGLVYIAIALSLMAAWLGDLEVQVHGSSVRGDRPTDQDREDATAGRVPGTGHSPQRA